MLDSVTEVIGLTCRFAINCYPQCQGRQGDSLRLVGATPKPSWSSVLTHRNSRCPQWYAEIEHAALCEQLERVYGIGYEDWCLGMGIESPMSALPVGVVQQLYLPSLWPMHDFTLESF